MASLVKSKISDAVHSSSTSNSNSHPNNSDSDASLASKYLLCVTAGPSYDPSTHKPIHVNSDTPCTVSNSLVTAKINVRIKNYHGLPSALPANSAYFSHPAHAKDNYSIGFSFVPNVDIPSEDLVWGNDFDHPVRDRLPPGFNTAFKIVKEFIDPGLSCDAYADAPWLYGPALSCWFAFHVGEKTSRSDSDSGSGDGGADAAVDFAGPSDQVPMTEGGSGSGASIRSELNIPPTAEKRRKHFLNPAYRQAFVFEKGRVYSGDFFNPYIDFGNFSLKLPGFSLSVLKWVDDKSHKLRYTCKNRCTGEVLFVVVFTLLFGEELDKALAEEKAGGREGKGEDGEKGRTEGLRGSDAQRRDSGAGEVDAVAQTDRHGQARAGAEPSDGDRPDSYPVESCPKIQLPTGNGPGPSISPHAQADGEKSPSPDQGVDEITAMLRDTATSYRADEKLDIMR